MAHGGFESVNVSIRVWACGCVKAAKCSFYSIQGGVLVCGGQLRNGYSEVQEGEAIWLQKEKASLFDLCNPFGTR